MSRQQPLSPLKHDAVHGGFSVPFTASEWQQLGVFGLSALRNDLRQPSLNVAMWWLAAVPQQSVGQPSHAKPYGGANQNGRQYYHQPEALMTRKVWNTVT
jgi:hypothetical protein